MTDEEVNIAVARKLGWTECQCAEEVREEHKRYMPSKHQMPDYCHSIAAAWEILPELPSVWSLIYRDGKFVLAFLDSSGMQGSGAQDIAPMAICLAYLKLTEDN